MRVADVNQRALAYRNVLASNQFVSYCFGIEQGELPISITTCRNRHLFIERAAKLPISITILLYCLLVIEIGKSAALDFQRSIRTPVR